MSVWRMEQELAAFAALKNHLGSEAEDMGLDLAEGETNLLEAVDRCLILFREAKAEEAANKSLKDTYAKRQQAAKGRQDLIRSALHKVRQALGEQTLKREIGTIYKMNSVEKVTITDPDKVPNAYRSNDFTPPPDKARILSAMKDGEEIDGCEYVPESEGTAIR